MIAETLLCLVISITDGDTLKVNCEDQTIIVRLAEIDAPEKRQSFGLASKRALSDLCLNEYAALRIEKLDRYRRSVARVKCQGKDASLEQVRTGLAWAYDKYLTDSIIKQSEGDAKRSKLGLWQDTEPVAPWVFRATTK